MTGFNTQVHGITRFYLENQFVGIHPIGKEKLGAQVPFQLRNLFNKRQKLRVDSLLVFLPLFCQLVFLQWGG